MRKRLDAQSYIRIIKYYIRTGDWIGMYWGEHEQNPTKWKIIAPGYKQSYELNNIRQCIYTHWELAKRT